ncbi:MAG: hypothetical protein MJE63_02360, partial [Proteobacteria bacterium]|nr:hypothetical protein [Pseudomonadota bacterium]
LKVFLPAGSYTLRAESATHFGETVINPAPLDILNPDIFLDQVLTASQTFTLTGEVLDAPVAFAEVRLVEYATNTILDGPVDTSADGSFALSTDLTSVANTTVLALLVDGQQADPGALVPNCNGVTPDTYVDIDKNGSFDATSDACLGLKASFVSILGTKNNVAMLDLDSNGIIDSANLPSLIVTHVTKAKELIMAEYLVDPSSDNEVHAYNSALESALAYEGMLQKQVAVIGALIRAINHQLTLPSNLFAGLLTYGTNGVIAKIIDNTFTLDAADLAFLESVISSDDTGALLGIMSVATDLSGVDFGPANDSPTINGTDPVEFANLNVLFGQLLDRFEINITSDPSTDNATLKTAFEADLHPDYMFNGKSRDQAGSRWADFVNEGIVGGGGLIIGFRHTFAHLTRFADGSGPVFFDTVNESFTNVDTGLPVYKKNGLLTAVFPSGSITFDMDNPEEEFNGFMVNDAGVLKEIGNQEKFSLFFGARNNGGQREIDLYIEDQLRGQAGNRFHITSIHVDVSDDALYMLTPAQLDWPGGGAGHVFRIDCSAADASDQILQSDYHCLNRFDLFFDDTDSDPYWGPSHRPGEIHINQGFAIPNDWQPDQDTVFNITVNYLDTFNANTSGVENYQRSFRQFPSDDYLAKLLWEDNPASLVDGSHWIGDETGLNLRWAFREFYDSPELIFPSKANLDIKLWNPDLEESLDHFEVELGANQRNVTINGNLSSYDVLELGLELNLPDGSRATSDYYLVKRELGRWYAYPFKKVDLNETFATVDDKTTALKVDTEYSYLSLYNAYGKIANTVDLVLTDYTVSTSATLPYKFNYDFWQNWRAVGANDVSITMEENVGSPTATVSFDPFYLHEAQTLSFDFTKVFDANASHQVQTLVLSYDGSTLSAVWTEPLDNATMTDHDDEVYYISFNTNFLGGSFNGYQVKTDTDFDIPLTSTDATNDTIYFSINATHHDYLVKGRYQLTCTIAQVTSGICQK